MVYVVDGKIGGGKSLLCIGKIVDQLIAGGLVVTNLELKTEEIDEWMEKRRRRVDWKRQYILHDFEKEPHFYKVIKAGTRAVPTLVVCDEAHIVYEAGHHAAMRTKFKDVGSWLSQSRKFNVDHYFIAQDKSLLWSMICKQAEHRINCVDMRKKSFGNLGTKPMANLEFWEKDMKSDIIIRHGTALIDKAYFKFYDTLQKFDQAMRDLEASLDVHEPVDTSLPSLRSGFIEWMKKPLLSDAAKASLRAKLGLKSPPPQCEQS